MRRLLFATSDKNI